MEEYLYNEIYDINLLIEYVKIINYNGLDIEISIFETFMLIKDHSSNLMLSFEQNFEDD